MNRDPRRRNTAVATALATAAGIALALLGAPGCAHRTGPPRISRGTPCATCGMGVEDPRFACQRDASGKLRVYDSIECLLQDAGSAVSANGVYLTDYDHGLLHAADSLWIVKGSFPTPMGGGLAAFESRAAADEVASRTQGRVGRLAELAAPPPGSNP